MTHKGKTDQKQETQQKQTKNPQIIQFFLLNTVIPKMVVVVFIFVCLKCCHIFCFVFLNVLFVVVVFVFFFEVLRLRAKMWSKVIRQNKLLTC